MKRKCECSAKRNQVEPGVLNLFFDTKHQQQQITSLVCEFADKTRARPDQPITHFRFIDFLDLEKAQFFGDDTAMRYAFGYGQICFSAIPNQ